MPEVNSTSLNETCRDIATELQCHTVRPNGRCFLCGGELQDCETRLFDTRFGVPGEYEVHRCRKCGFEQMSPIPTMESLKALYESYYNFGAETNTLYTKIREHFLFSTNYRLWMWIDGDISFHMRKGKGRLLDIGCNEGRGLQMYSRHGFQAEGLELNEIAAAAAKTRGFVVHTAALEEFRPSVPYDVVVLSNVLEHSLNPTQMLANAHRILATGGEIWISCPNSLSWLRKVFGNFWINWHVPFHISHFNSTILVQMLGNAGYGNIRIQQITPASWVAQSLIARLYSQRGKKNRQMRSPFLMFIFMALARGVFFPALWLGNVCGRGDCLLITASKARV